MKTITNIIYPAFALFALACFAFLSQAQAVTPAPDGGYPGQNTAEGDEALLSLTRGLWNTALGFQALKSDTDGNFNTAVGHFALNRNTTGGFNTANGNNALANNTTGFKNTANGLQALGSNTTGEENTATGTAALFKNTTGSHNVAIGFEAGSNLTTGDFNIDIGNRGVADETHTIRVGRHGMQIRTFIAGIGGTAVTGSPVVVDASGQLGVAPSSARFKDETKPMDKASEAILALKPVTFHYKKQLDPEGMPQFGLVAEEVEKVNPALVTRDAEGKVFTVRYDAVNAMLLNEFLKEHRKTEKLEATVVRQQKQIEALTAGLQKVSAQLELRKSAPQTVQNNQ